MPLNGAILLLEGKLQGLLKAAPCCIQLQKPNSASHVTASSNMDRSRQPGGARLCRCMLQKLDVATYVIVAAAMVSLALWIKTVQ